MKTIAFCWQLGAGLGHILRAYPLAKKLLSEGHRVILCFHDLTTAGEIFKDLDVEYFQAPARTLARAFYPFTVSFSHLLTNAGFSTVNELFALGSAWRNIFELVKPDLAVFDHSPIALLASRCFGFKRVIIGTGFVIPPNTYPLPVFLTPEGSIPKLQKIKDEEDVVVNIVNSVLAKFGEKEIEHLSQIYHHADELFLTTLLELDHFGPRHNATYWGPILGSGGIAPTWGEDGEAKIFAYLKPFPRLPELLNALKESSYSTIVVCDGISDQIQKQFASPRLCFSKDRLDPARFEKECDVAILNGNHNSTCGMLLSGKPIFQIPLNPEQLITARNVKALGAGEIMRPDIGFDKALNPLVKEKRYFEAARNFANKYSDLNQEEQLTKIHSRLLELI